MCNIAGYAGTQPAAPILIKMMLAEEGFGGGYYSGIATIHEGKIHYAKLTGDMKNLLENTDAQLPCGLHIIGAADYIYHTPNLEGLTGEGFDLLLAHEPDLADAVSGVELQLSGHSHGGQVYLPFLVQEFLPGGAQNYIRSRYEKADGGIVYVNRGIGMSMLPVRLFSRPEITILTIHGEE